MHPRLSRIALLATALLVALPSFALANNTPVEGTTSKSYPEDYESFSTTGVNPSSPWGTYTTAGTGTYLVATGGACTGTRCLAVQDTVTATFSVDFNNDGLGVNLCTAGQSVTFSFALSAGMTLNQVWHIRIATAGPTVVANPANSIDIALTGSLAATEAATIVLNSNTGTQTPVSIGSYTAPGVVGVTLDTMNCVGSTPSIHYTVLGGGLSSTGTFTSSSLVSGDFDSLQVASSSTALPSNTVDLDNINWQGAPLPAPTVSSISPVRGPSDGGTPVTITGTGFKTGASASIGGTPLTGVSVVSGTTITGTTGGHVAGTGFTATVVNPDSQQATGGTFTYDPAPAPILSALTPNNAKIQGGDLINVTGSNFRTGFTATFDGTPAISPTFVSASLVRVTTPPHSIGTITFRFCNLDTQCATKPFTYREATSGEGGETPPGGPLTVSSPTIIGAVNQDNAYGAYSNGIDLVVLVHTVDTSNILVVEKSTNGGSSFSTLSTGLVAVTDGYSQLQVSASDSTHIVIIDCENTLRAIYTTDGVNYAASTIGVNTGTDGSIRGCALSQSGGTWLVSYWNCIAAGTGGACHRDGAPGPDYEVDVMKSTNNGATWTSAGINIFNGNGAYGTTAGDALGKASTAIVQASSSIWTTYYSGCQSNDPFFGKCRGFLIGYRSTTDSGANYGTESRINDAFSPLTDRSALAFGASSDGTGFTFITGATNDDSTTFGKRYIAQPYPGGQWIITNVDLNTPQLGDVAQTYSCSGGGHYGFYQGVSNQDRLTGFSVTGDGATVVKTAMTGSTATTKTTYASYRLGGLLYFMVPSPAGAIELRSVTNACPSGGAGNQATKCIFCSASGNDNFGYDFVEGVTLGTRIGEYSNGQSDGCLANDGEDLESRSAVDVVPCYKFQGDASNFDYLAKSWANGQTHVASYFNIEAATEGVSSVFRSSFSAVAGVPNNAAKGSCSGSCGGSEASGDCQGLCNGQFGEHVEARFKEVDNDWNVQIYQVSQSHSVTVRTALGQSFIGDSPNTPTSYNFSVDNSASPPKAYVKRITPEIVSCSKAGSFLLADGTCTTKNFIETDLFPGGVTLPGYWSGVGMLNQWFVGYATDTNFNNDATTRLEPGGDATGEATAIDFSTCIYAFGVTTAPITNGDQGRVPPPDSDGDGLPDALDQDDDNDGTPDTTDTTPGTDTTPITLPGDEDPLATGSFFLPENAVLPAGFTRSTFSFLLGILFMFFLAAGTYFTLGKNAVAGAIGGGAGFMGAFAFGLFPLWAVLLVALACAAILVLRFKGGGG